MNFFQRANEAFSLAVSSIGGQSVERARYTNDDPFELDLGGLPAKVQGRYRSQRAWVQAVMASPIVRPIISRIATDVGCKEYFVQKANGDKWEKAVDGPAVDFLEDPWNFLMGGTLHELFEWFQGSADIVGNWFALKDLSPTGKLKGLIPIPSHLVTVDVLRVPGSKYDGQTWFNVVVPGTQVSLARIPAAWMVWHREPNWFDPTGVGTGLVACLNDELNADEAAAKFMASFFANGATPHTIVSIEDSKITEGQVRKLKQQWLKDHQGVTNAFRTMFTNKGLKINTMSPSGRDMQTIEGRKLNRDLALMTYQMPGEIMAIGDNTTRGSMPESDKFYNKIVVGPRMLKMVGTMNRQVFKRHFKGYRLWYKSPVREMLNDRRETAVQLYTNGLINLDQAREMVDQDPVGGDIGASYMVPGNMFLLDKNRKVIMSTTTPKGDQAAEKPGGSTAETTPNAPKKKSETRLQQIALEGFYRVSDS